MKVSLAVVLGLVLTLGLGAQNRTPLTSDLGLATVQFSRNSETFTLFSSDFKALLTRAQTRVNRPLTLAEKKELLDQTISENLISQAALESPQKVTLDMLRNQVRSQSQAKDDATINKQLDQLARQSGARSPADMARTVSVQNYIRAHEIFTSSSPKEPTEKEIKDFFEENETRFVNPRAIRVSHIFFDGGTSGANKAAAKRKADEVLQSIRGSKTTFEAAVLDVSEDPSSRYSHGDLGFTSLETAENTFMGKDTVKELFDLNVGDVSKVFESLRGYHIFKITDKRAKKNLSLEDPLEWLSPKTVKQNIRELLESRNRAEHLADTLGKIAAQLRRQNPNAVKVNVTDAELQNL